MLSVAVPRASNAGDRPFVLLASPLRSTVGRIRVLVVDYLGAVASRQGLQNLGRNRFLEEQHGTVGECEVRTARVMAEQALDIELNGNVPVVWLGPGDGGGVTSLHDEDRVRQAIRDRLRLDRFDAGEDRGGAAWRQIARLA